MNQFDIAAPGLQGGNGMGKNNGNGRRATRLAGWVLVLVAATALSACGSKDKKPGQALASVNGNDITVLQLNEELQRANVPQAQHDAASKQLLESLVDRQLALDEAGKQKLDRDPVVVQAIERAKALIIAQAYMQKRVGATARPTKAEVSDYFDKHPEFFIHNKRFEMRELTLATKDLTPELSAAMDGFKSLDDVAAWLDAHKVVFGRAALARASAELPPEMASKLQAMPKGQIFIVREGERSLIMNLVDIKDSPVALATAAPQIEQFLYNKKTKDAAAAELARLRGAAKIVYYSPTTGAATPAAPAAAASAASTSVNDRGVAGLK
ncbi:EpsD family peptidyl-prolyl cis-trans isomerase [Rugamonas sp.]|uniref:EpsD family peptidyl-prolyl cis-trans isomerase n=1 Tax=Rugamonas sp. TaxID=1926287 RepID=UPI0025F1276E|nr:EpsD family peptidyl-prolyl cis-trans isomerase [Rugamonas sp.]